MNSVPVAAQQVGSPRHTVVGDVHLLLRRGDEVLFGRRRNTGFEDGAWHLPSGHLEAGESVVDAVIREAAEEVGVAVTPADLMFSHVLHNASSGGRVAFFFTARAWSGEPANREPDKCDELAWFAVDALPDRMIDYCRAAVAHIVGGSPFSVHGW